MRTLIVIVAALGISTSMSLAHATSDNVTASGNRASNDSWQVAQTKNEGEQLKDRKQDSGMKDRKKDAGMKDRKKDAGMKDRKKDPEIKDKKQ